MNKASDYIAVFDSGVGGISVLRQLRKIMPQERYLYFGDSVNAPYGVRPESQVRALTFGAVDKLLPWGIKALVVACNTATSAAFDDLVQVYPEITIIGIEPAVPLAAEKFPGGHIGVLATPATLAGERFLRSKAAYDAVCRITPLPAFGLTELVEAGKYDSPEVDTLLQSLFAPYRDTLDAVVLGCTHYAFVEKALGRVLGKDMTLLDGAGITAAATRDALEQKGLLYQGPGELVIENSLPGERMIALSRALAE